MNSQGWESIVQWHSMPHDPPWILPNETGIDVRDLGKWHFFFLPKKIRLRLDRKLVALSDPCGCFSQETDPKTRTPIGVSNHHFERWRQGYFLIGSVALKASYFGPVQSALLWLRVHFEGQILHKFSFYTIYDMCCNLVCFGHFLIIRLWASISNIFNTQLYQFVWKRQSWK